jgi:serine/threonine protein kinase
MTCAAWATQSQPYSEKCDVYSFGVLVWEMATRQTPYQGIPPLSVAFGVGSGTLRLNIPTHAPPILQRVMRACLSHDHHQRPSFHRLLGWLEDGLEAERTAAAAASAGGGAEGLSDDASQSSLASWSTDSHSSARDYFAAQVRQQAAADDRESADDEAAHSDTTITSLNVR